MRNFGRIIYILYTRNNLIRKKFNVNPYDQPAVELIKIELENS